MGQMSPTYQILRPQHSAIDGSTGPVDQPFADYVPQDATCAAVADGNGDGGKHRSFTAAMTMTSIVTMSFTTPF